MESGLFSAVTSAFIIDIQSELKPDYQEMNNTLLELLLNATVGKIPPDQPISPPRWAGPNPAIRQAQAILYATLCATLFAAFLATLGKQWLNRYRQADAHGSIQDRCRDRERKLSGIDRWWFHNVMQFAPITIQGSLGLLGSALSLYLWEVDRTVSSVVIGFTFFGCVLYMAIVTVSVLSFDCPFQTPVSLLIRSGINTTKLWWQDHYGVVTPNVGNLAARGLAVSVVPFRDLHEPVLHSAPSPSWGKGYRFDARCITRMLVMSTDADTTRLTMNLVQEVVWGVGIKDVPLGWIHRILTGCFDTTHPDAPILIPTLRDVAYLSAKAFTRIQVQRRCVPVHGDSGRADEDRLADENLLKDIHHTRLGFQGSSGDPDLESVLLMVDKEFTPDVNIPWNKYRLTPAHHLWVSHLFVYDASHDPLPDSVSNFVEYSLNPSNSPGDAVNADCLCIIDAILGNGFDAEYLAMCDKRFDLAVFFYAGADVIQAVICITFSVAFSKASRCISRVRVWLTRTGRNAHYVR